MKAVVAAFNQEKALIGAFSVITNLRMELFEALEDIAAGGREVRNLTNLHNPSCVQRLGSSYLNNGHLESGICVAEVDYFVT